MFASAPPATPATLSQALNQKIREFLETQRLSQREFAAELGVTQGAVSYMLAEKRRASVLDYYERLARIFDLSLSALIADLEQRVSKPEGGAAPSEQVAAQHLAHTMLATAQAHRGRIDQTQALGLVLDTMISARLDAHGAHVASLLAEARAEVAKARAEARAARRDRDAAAPARRKRSRPTPRERTDDRVVPGAMHQSILAEDDVLDAG